MVILLKAVLLGLPGIVAFALTVAPPAGVPAALLLVNPLVLLLLGALAGGWAARKVDLQSAIILSSCVSMRMVLSFAGAGLIAGLGIALLDTWSAALWNPGPLRTLRESSALQSLAVNLLYGGITEEIIFRWGLLSLLAAGASRLFSRRVAVSIGAVLAALIFALAHLPIVVQEAGLLTVGLAVRTILWNGLLGLLFGAAFVRGGLESAIGAHVSFHFGVVLAARF